MGDRQQVDWWIDYGDESVPKSTKGRAIWHEGRRQRTIVSIGARWGFPDPVTFNRAFRREYGLPPGEYRRRHLPAPQD